MFGIKLLPVIETLQDQTELHIIIPDQEALPVVRSRSIHECHVFYELGNILYQTLLQHRRQHYTSSGATL